MAHTVIGVFHASAAATHAAEKLAERGFDPSALHIASHQPPPEPEEAREDGMPPGIRNLLAELFGTRHAEESGHPAEAAHRSLVFLAVDVPDGTPLETVRQALLDAGAREIHERLQPWRLPDRDDEAESRPYEQYEPDYRKDFQIRYAGRGGTYEDYAHAYRYGHNLASDPRYQDRDWQSIEPEARRDWESEHPESTWERFKLAIQHGWERVTGRH